MSAGAVCPRRRRPERRWPAGPGRHQWRAGTLTLLRNTTQPGTTTVSFAAQPVIVVGSKPTDLAVADLDGDGRPDLIVASAGDAYQSDGALSVLWNTTAKGSSDLSFAPPKVLVSDSPSSVVVADLNGDGKPDLLVGDYAGPYAPGGTVIVLLNTTAPGAAPSFAPPQTLPGDASSVRAAVADLNDDGKPDVLVTNKGRYTETPLLNTTADGAATVSFVPQPTFRVGTRVYAVAVADLNGDGKPDLVIADKPHATVIAFPGNGDGTFQIQPTFRVQPGPASVVLTDVNGDGIPDLVSADHYANTVSVLLGNGDGTFAAQQTFKVGNIPQAVVVGDVNGDGIPDIVVANTGDNTVSVLLGNGDGTFQDSAAYLPKHTFAAGPAPDALAVADVNGDGKMDLIVADAGDGLVRVLLGSGGGAFLPPRAFATNAGSSLSAVAVADVNGDGKLDLIVAGSDGSKAARVSVLLGSGNGTFQDDPVSRARHTFAVDGGAGPDALAVADLNGDGKPDLIVTDAASNQVSVLLNSGGGLFGTAKVLSGDVGPKPVAVVAADFNGDGSPDLAVVNQGTNDSGFDTISVLLNTTVAKSMTVSFGPPMLHDVGLNPSAVAVADVNRDGKFDLAVANRLNNTLSVLLGNGDGTFTDSTSVNGVQPRNTPFLVDLDGDGIPDRIVLDSAGNILFRKGLANGQFDASLTLNDDALLGPGQARPARDLTAVYTGLGWALATVDARPDPSLSSPGQFLYTISLYVLGADDKEVARKSIATSFVLPTRIAAADLTDPVGVSNGLEDLVVLNSLSNSLTILRQTSPGIFALAPLTTGSAAPRTLPSWTSTATACATSWSAIRRAAT